MSFHEELGNFASEIILFGSMRVISLKKFKEKSLVFF